MRLPVGGRNGPVPNFPEDGKLGPEPTRLRVPIAMGFTRPHDDIWKMNRTERAEPLDRDTTRAVGLIRRAAALARRQASKNRLFVPTGAP
jgi:hypothetical protein